jgi:hypothetical protein
VKGERVVSTRRCTSKLRKRREVVPEEGPGRRPLSQSTWKPLQMPTTGPPARAKAFTASMTGERWAMAPGTQVVAVGEAAREKDRIDVAQRALAVPDELGLEPLQEASAPGSSRSRSWTPER